MLSENLIKAEAMADATEEELLAPARMPVIEEVDSEEEEEEPQSDAVRGVEQEQAADRAKKPRTTRPLISLDGEDQLVAHYTAPSKAVTTIEVTYTNFVSAKKLPPMSDRQRRGITHPKAKLTPQHNAANNHALLSKSAQYTVEHMKIDPYSYSQNLDKQDFSTMYRLCIEHGWSSFDELTVAQRDKRRDKFNDGQRLHGCDVKRLKTRTGFEAALRKIERDMCWKAARGLCELHICQLLEKD